MKLKDREYLFKLLETADESEDSIGAYGTELCKLLDKSSSNDNDMFIIGAQTQVLRELDDNEDSLLIPIIPGLITFVLGMVVGALLVAGSLV